MWAAWAAARASLDASSAIMDDSTAAFAANSAPVFVLCEVVARHMAVAAAEIAWAAAELLAAASAATRDAYLKYVCLKMKFSVSYGVRSQRYGETFHISVYILSMSIYTEYEYNDSVVHSYPAAWEAVARRAMAAAPRMHSQARSPLPEGLMTLRLEE